jgi:hypothetical protein
MSMNFNSNPTPIPAPKKNNSKLIAEIIIAVVLGTFGAIGIWHYVMEMDHIVPNSEGTTSTHDDLQQKLFTKCQNLQDYYNSIGVDSDYKCDKYAKAWSGLVK